MEIGIEEDTLADEVGLDVFGVGEHHRPEYVTSRGRRRPALTGQGVYPRPVQDPRPVRVAVGGTPQSVDRAAAPSAAAA